MVCASDDVSDGGGLAGWHDHGRAVGQAQGCPDPAPHSRGAPHRMAKGCPRQRDRIQPRAARVLQVLQLRSRQLERGDDVRRPGDGPMGHGAADHAAAGDQLLHVPVHELRHRRLSRRCQGHPVDPRLHVLCGDVPPAGGRPDHSVSGCCRPVSGADAHAGKVCAGRCLFLAWSWEEDPLGQPVRESRRHRV